MSWRSPSWAPLASAAAANSVMRRGVLCRLDRTARGPGADDDRAFNGKNQLSLPCGTCSRAAHAGCTRELCGDRSIATAVIYPDKSIGWASQMVMACRFYWRSGRTGSQSSRSTGRRCSTRSMCPPRRRLAAVWREIADDAGCRVAILTGAGEKAFCAGSDIKEISRTGSMVTTDTLLRAIPGVGIPLVQAGDRGAARLLHWHGHEFRVALRPAPRGQGHGAGLS